MWGPAANASQGDCPSAFVPTSHTARSRLTPSTPRTPNPGDSGEQTTAPSLQPIPHPPDRPIVGNIFDLSASTQVQDLMRMARRYGGIFYLSIGGRRNIFVSDFELVDELCDESRFDKRVWAPLKNVRTFAGDGLFTAHTFEPNWKKAHNILLPNFSMAAMKRYHPMMIDIARQMLEKWERLNPGEEIEVSDEMTRLTLDTIGVCGFDYRFNSFYRERPHPFIRAMTRSLGIAMDRTARPDIVDRLQFLENKRFRNAVELMNRTVDGIIRERRDHPERHEDATDLLNAMLVGTDRETGEGLDDLNIRYQIITFLIAGHETTSGLLSFATHFLLKHPAVLRRATEEVDRVLGHDLDADPAYRQVTELRYVRQVLSESLRLWPTAPMFALFPKEGETVLGDRYAVSKRDGLAVHVPMLHRDPRIWGPNPERFDPDHFSPEAERARPANAYKPFGNGQRSCIGRQFALHEATLALGMMLQRFELIDPHDYQLKVKETLTLKPEGLRIQVRRRALEPLLRRARTGSEASEGSERGSDEARATAAPAARLPVHATPMQVLFGSNMGTAESVAAGIGEAAERRGFTVSVEPLDHAAGALSRDGLVVIVSASYNGTPPDNALRFASWLDDAVAEAGDYDDSDAPLAGVRYAVFGCGHHDWAATYQAVPRRFDEQLAALGAERVAPRGAGDVGDDFEGDLESWADAFWPAAAAALELDLELKGADADAGSPAFAVEVVADRHPNPFVQAFRARPLVVVENRELQSPAAGRSTRHIELALPEDISYRTGDHLGVIARNHPAVVQRVLERFAFDEQTRIRIHRRSGGQAEFPLGEPIVVADLLADYVELQEPATRAQIKLLLEHTRCPPERPPLEALVGDDDASRERYRSEVLGKRRSVLDLLEESPACELPFGVYLGMLPALRPRYYSISSSPLVAERLLSLTVAVVSAPARSGHGTYHGPASTHLAEKERGQTVFGFVRDNQSRFRPPQDPATPLIMIGPGTGVAPFRGFLQERLALRQQGDQLGPALLFFGCRHPEHDDIYRDELDAFEAAEVVDVVTAYSRAQEKKVYVQHQIAEHADRVWALLEQGAVVYVCGDASSMAPAVRAELAGLYRRRADADQAAAEAWLEDLEQRGRYRVDVWAST
ncbi:MAG: cytochrome P450 [Acidobacteria bacterium]|nr:MAG: cytochrome P450 [Acidobacteriota bacterium]